MAKLKNKPYMKKSEWQFLTSFLKEHHSMLEFGSGNSTVHLSKKVKELWSIEHDKQWFETVSDTVSYTPNVSLFLIENDLPRTIPTKYEQFSTYINWIKKQDKKFDIVLIDGRARQWCAEAVLNNLKDNHLVFLHDWVNERPQYKHVLNFYDVVDQKDRMIILKKKN